MDKEDMKRSTRLTNWKRISGIICGFTIFSGAIVKYGPFKIDIKPQYNHIIKQVIFILNGDHQEDLSSSIPSADKSNSVQLRSHASLKTPRGINHSDRKSTKQNSIHRTEPSSSEVNDLHMGGNELGIVPRTETPSSDISNLTIDGHSAGMTRIRGFDDFDEKPTGQNIVPRPEAPPSEAKTTDLYGGKSSYFDSIMN